MIYNVSRFSPHNDRAPPNSPTTAAAQHHCPWGTRGYSTTLSLGASEPITIFTQRQMPTHPTDGALQDCHAARNRQLMHDQGHIQRPKGLAQLPGGILPLRRPTPMHGRFAVQAHDLLGQPNQTAKLRPCPRLSELHEPSSRNCMRDCVE